MELFRVDKRLYNLDSLIISSNQYQLKINDKGRSLESCLDKYRPNNKPRRNQYLFAFEEYKDAYNFWTKMIDGKFYKVLVEEKDILHKGDMKIIDKLFKIQNPDNEELCNMYWEGLGTSNPCWEYIVTKAYVIDLISIDEKARQLALNKRWGMI